MNSEQYSSILSEELKPLHAQIEQVKAKIETLEDRRSVAESELETYADERKRYEVLREICSGLDTLSELDAEGLFWDDLKTGDDAGRHVSRLRERISSFEADLQVVEDRQSDLKAQIELCLEELDILDDEVREAYGREERRQEEFVIEREMSPLPYRKLIMPWTTDGESERQFRRFVLVALLLCIVFGSLIPLVNIPLPDRSVETIEIPERLAKLVKKEPEPLPEPKQPKQEKPPEEEDEEKPKKEKKASQKKETKVAATKEETKAARKKAESTGVLAFKETFKDLMEETPVAKLGTEARINTKARRTAGAARAQRSIVSTQATGSSAGIATAAISRNIGNGGKGNGDRIGGVGFTRVESAVAGLAEEEARPLSEGPGPARTDEEIQIVFDRYKATLYRIYNKELRKDPTLRGKLLLKITIEPEGGVSLCQVESTDLDSEVLVAKIVKRVERFNFGPKENVPKTTILYPIDFLPAG